MCLCSIRKVHIHVHCTLYLLCGSVDLENIITMYTKVSQARMTVYVLYEPWLGDRLV